VQPTAATAEEAHVTQNGKAPQTVGGVAGAPAGNRVSMPETANTGCCGGLNTCDILISIGDVPYAWDIANDTITWGSNLCRVLKIADPALAATGKSFASLLAPDNSYTRFDAVVRSPHRDEGDGVAYEVQYGLIPPNNGDERLWLEDVGRWFAGPDGLPARAHGVVRIINERRAREERLAYLSRFDGLTGEMNRWHMTDVLAATVEEAIRFRASCGFLVVAVNSISRINEACGFEVADEVIAAVAKRLRARMRGGDHLGRFSGNKFGVVLRQCTADDMAIAAERLLAGVREGVVQTTAGPVAATATIGGVVAPRHAKTVSEVLARAQEALDAAQAKRTGSFRAYQPSVEREALRRQSLRTSDEIISALNERRVRIAFEPVVATATRKPAFYECLLRLRRPDGDLVKAHDVISVAERLGLVPLLDHRVLELLVDEMLRTPDLCASLNVSPASIFDPDWWSGLSVSLRVHPEVAIRLLIEITETAVIQDIDETRGFVARAKDLGCRIAIDDFGAGYTSFRNLRKLGVDIVKIDGAFVQHVTRSEDDRAFVQTILDLARRLKLQTVAERVQDEEAAQLLAEWGCDYLQGALIGLAQIERPWLARKRLRAAAGD
jgi:diguanylate cyclase (GGDEF)-like protein